MGSKSDELKEVKCSINFIKIQLDSVNNRYADTDDIKYHESYDNEENHGKIQRSKNVNPALTLKGGVMKDKIIYHNSEWPAVLFNVSRFR